MPSPFPGMDPFIEDERIWPSFQHAFIACLHRIIQPGLTSRYGAHIAERCYATEGAQQHEPYIEVRLQDGSRLVTLFDVVSPANKTTAAGRETYLDTRQKAKTQGANLVELDLVLQGQPTLEYSREGLPDWDYAATVTRCTQPERFEIYTSTLQKRLPRFRLPLAADDRDMVVDLQTCFTRCYEEAGLAERINYECTPAAPLKEEDRRWLDELLQAHKLRQPPEWVAVAAYYLWQQEGCPDGLDREHWRRAVEQIKQARNG